MATARIHQISPGSVPVREGMARVHAVIDTIDLDAVTGVTGQDISEIDRGIARMEAMKLAAIAAADLEAAGTRGGMSSTSAWVAANTRSPGAKAAADLTLATALRDSLPVTKAALVVGALSTAHAAIIAGTLSRLPETLTPTERAKVETALVAQAKQVDPTRLRKAARRALLAAERTEREALEHEDAELRGEEARAEKRIRLTMHDNNDGTVTGHFTVPSLAGAILRKTIQQMISPRRHRDDPTTSPQWGGGSAAAGSAIGASSPGAVLGNEVGTGSGARRGTGASSGPRGSFSSPVRDIDWANRSGRAFVELLEHLPTDRLTSKVAATIVVTIDHDRLRESLGAAHLDTGLDLSAAETRRLACNAGILPAILDGTSLPLDLGRTKRFFTEAQRVALATTYDECAADGCDRPFSWCELHHQDPWARNGPTDLHLAVPLCCFHHHRAHDPRYDATMTTDPHGRKHLRLHLAE
ncbi:MAG: DUF222 domain-containing protein [Ornithinibacter sp.]